MHVLVTGNSGLIGSEAVRFFDRLGFRVPAVDHSPYTCSGTPNLAPHRPYGRPGYSLGQIEETAAGLRQRLS